jgi:hypothetical protein
VTVVEGVRYGAAAGGLGAIERRQVSLEQAQLDPLLETLRDLGEERARRDRTDDAVRQLEAELLGNFEAERLRALRVVRTKVDVHERPGMLGRELRAESVDVVVVAAHRNEVRAVYAGREDLLLLEVGRHEHVGLEPGSGCVRGDGVRQVPRGGAGDHVEVELLRLGDGHADDAVLE